MHTYIPTVCMHVDSFSLRILKHVLICLEGICIIRSSICERNALSWRRNVDALVPHFIEEGNVHLVSLNTTAGGQPEQ